MPVVLVIMWRHDVNLATPCFGWLPSCLVEKYTVCRQCCHTLQERLHYIIQPGVCHTPTYECLLAAEMHLTGPYSFQQVIFVADLSDCVGEKGKMPPLMLQSIFREQQPQDAVKEYGSGSGTKYRPHSMNCNLTSLSWVFIVQHFTFFCSLNVIVTEQNEKYSKNALKFYERREKCCDMHVENVTSDLIDLEFGQIDSVTGSGRVS